MEKEAPHFQMEFLEGNMHDTRGNLPLVADTAGRTRQNDADRRNSCSLDHSSSSGRRFSHKIRNRMWCTNSSRSSFLHIQWISVWCLLFLMQQPTSAFAVLPKKPPTATISQQSLNTTLSNPFSVSTSTTATTATPGSGTIPFLVEVLTEPQNPTVYREIASMCIAAFFNDGDEKFGRTSTPPWKEWQLAYLRTLQQNDLRRRRRLHQYDNFMLVARRVIPADENEARHRPLLVDLKNCNIYNLPHSSLSSISKFTDSSLRETDYVRGEVIGFVEVTQKIYGLGPFANDPINGAATIQQLGNDRQLRPFLTNLSVQYAARGSGVGSALLDLCEKEVVQRWNKNEIVLEVEDDNINALRFYQKRGYQLLFQDPTSRRFDLSGLWLQQRRCNRYVMRKVIPSPSPTFVSTQNGTTFEKGLQTLLRLRSSLFG